MTILEYKLNLGIYLRKKKTVTALNVVLLGQVRYILQCTNITRRNSSMAFVRFLQVSNSLKCICPFFQ